MTEPLLDIQGVTKEFGGGFLAGGKPVAALREFSLALHESPAAIVTIAGESGSGKSTLANLVLGFLTPTSGRVLFRGRDVAAMKGAALLEYRRQVQAVFQDPYAVYNPFYKARHIFDLVMKRFALAATPREARERIEGALGKVGLRGEEVLDRYPHQLSGGQRQRMMVARAWLMSPRLIVADEPVSMVDASLRSMILDIMLRLRDEDGISFLYITHDLSTAYQIGDDIHLLYRGATVERGPVTAVIEKPLHPYAQLLIRSIPQPDPTDRWAGDLELPEEDETAAGAGEGCPFFARCPQSTKRCARQRPPQYPIDDNTRHTACFLHEQNAPR